MTDTELVRSLRAPATPWRDAIAAAARIEALRAERDAAVAKVEALIAESDLAVAEIAALRAREAWRPIAEAKKDGTPILVKFHADIYPRLRPERDDLEPWNGLYVVLRHPGVADNGFDVGWNFAAPVGHGGFPDEWIAGWLTVPPPEPAS